MSEMTRRETTNEANGRTTTRRQMLGGLCAGILGALTGCVSTVGPPATETQQPSTLTSTHDVVTGSRRQRLTVSVPAKEYRQSLDAGHSLPAALKTARQRRYLDTIAARLDNLAATRADAVRAVQSLAVNVPYTTDEESTDETEFVRYPAETLVHAKGDCEDKAVLIAGILSRSPFDCRTALVLLRNHCATLVARPDLPADLVAEDPVTATVDGVDHVYVESVEPATFGETGPDYDDRPLLAAYNGSWTVLDFSAAAASVRKGITRRGIDVVESFV